MYNLIEYSDNYSKACGSLWQYCKDILIHLVLKLKEQVSFIIMKE